jgi:hypothetical protein
MRIRRRDFSVDVRYLAFRERDALRRCRGHKPRRRRPQSWFGRTLTNLIRPFLAPEPVPVAVLGRRWL